MSAYLDRVAHAIANGGDWQKDYTEEQRDLHRQRARKGIEAMREPTDDMVKMGFHAPMGEIDWLKAVLMSWQAMIDEALK